MGSRKTGGGVEKVYEAASQWVERALHSDDSLFTPGEAIWTSENLRQLRERFLNRPDAGESEDFYQKLETQLKDSPPKVYQLMAEVLYVHFLIIWQGAMRRDTKADRINRVLQWSDSPVVIPDRLIAGLNPGIVHPGQGFSRYRPYQVGLIIEFVEQWKDLESWDQQLLLDDAWAFKDFLMGIKLRSSLYEGSQNTPRIQRRALLHLLFPDDIEGMVSSDHRKAIAAAFASYVIVKTDDIDRQLKQIRQYLEMREGREIDFFASDIRSAWEDPSRPISDEFWDEFVRIAQIYIEDGSLSRESYKFNTGRRLEDARRTVLAGGEDWNTLVKIGIAGNLIYSVQQSRFRNWLDDSPDDALQALWVIWAENDSSVAQRIRAFGDLLPTDVLSGAGTRMNVISVLLMGLDAERYPPFRVMRFDEAYERTDYPPRESQGG